MTILLFKNKAYLFRSASANAGKFWPNSSRIRLSRYFCGELYFFNSPISIKLVPVIPSWGFVESSLEPDKCFRHCFSSSHWRGRPRSLTIARRFRHGEMPDQGRAQTDCELIYSVSHYTRRWRTMGALNSLACVCAQAMKFPAYFY